MKNRTLGVLIMFLLLLVSCAPKKVEPENKEKLLLTRVKAYWDLRIKGAGPQERLPFERCGLDPKCKEAFLKGGSGNTITYYSYEILGVEYPDENTALVKIKVRYKTPPLLGFSFEQTGTFKDKWVYINGQWYHVIKGFSKEW